MVSCWPLIFFEGVLVIVPGLGTKFKLSRQVGLSNERWSGRPPFGLRWRSSYWFTTFIVGLGITTDLLVYSIIIPVMPFQLERLGYSDVSSLTGWLLFAYSAGLALSTIPIAMLSERYSTRKVPLISGLIVLLGSEIMLMEAPIYAVMCIARILQGIGSSMVWVVGLALLCDSAPEKYVGRQLGIAMSGFSMGAVIGPPVGGALYGRFGFRGPFIFGISATFIDLVGRMLIVERKEAKRWGIDPAADPELNKQHQSTSNKDKDEEKVHERPAGSKANVVSTPNVVPPSLLTVMIKLSKSSRALTSIIVTLAYGTVYSCQEPTIPLHMQSIWGLNSSKVGLVFLAAVVPTLFSSPISGWYADKKGSEWMIFLSLLLSLPWWAMLIIQGPLAFFIVAFALQSLFTSGVISPLTAELAAVARGIEGIGYAHVYGAFNLAYGIGTTVGPVVGGQIYDHVKHGWTAICLLAVGAISGSILLSFFYTGNDPLVHRLKRVLYNRAEQRSTRCSSSTDAELEVVHTRT